MSKRTSNREFAREQSVEREELLPLESAADVGRGNYARVQFDQHISEMLEQHARERAPSESKSPDRNYRNHLLGVASEVGVATWQNGQIDTQVYPDFCGDDGADVIAPSKWSDGTDRYQVKATREVSSPERVVAPDEIQKADVLVLCCTNAPSRYVEIIGYTRPAALKAVGQVYGRDGYLLSPETLYPVRPALHTADDVRQSMYGGRQ